MFYRNLFKYSVKSRIYTTSTLRMTLLMFRNSQQLAAVSSVTHSHRQPLVAVPLILIPGDLKVDVFLHK